MLGVARGSADDCCEPGAVRFRNVDEQRADIMQRPEWRIPARWHEHGVRLKWQIDRPMRRPWPFGRCAMGHMHNAVRIARQAQRRVWIGRGRNHHLGESILSFQA